MKIGSIAQQCYTSLLHEGVTVMGGTMARRRPGAKKAQASLVASKAEANKKYEQASKTQDKKPAKKSKG